MAEEHRKRRSKAEVAAAREQYLKEREAKQQARAERRAEREKIIAERQARKEQREKLRNMTEGERAQAKYEAKLEKARKDNKKETHPLARVKPYQGMVEVGKDYTIRFAGSLHYGTCIQHKSPEDIPEEGQVRVRYEIFLLETREPKSGGYWIYPAKREDILAEGVLDPENLGYPNNIKFNGISYI